MHNFNKVYQSTNLIKTSIFFYKAKIKITMNMSNKFLILTEIELKPN